MPYSVIVEDEPACSLAALDNSVRTRILKKLAQLERDEISSRHLEHGLPYFVEEVGGYRIAFKTREDLRQRRVMFIGSHKDYEKWYSKK